MALNIGCLPSLTAHNEWYSSYNTRIKLKTKVPFWKCKRIICTYTGCTLYYTIKMLYMNISLNSLHFITNLNHVMIIPLKLKKNKNLQK